MIGGGGFLAVQLTTKGIDLIEGSLELGGNISIDLAIVSANAHVLAGFYFNMTSGQGFAFAGYLRIGAFVSVLGLISVSIELYLALDFSAKTKPSTIGGEASLVVGIHLLFIDKSVTLHTERHFAVPQRANIPIVGGVHFPFLSDPSFDELMSLDDWRSYCQAFA
jgi:hypothetical protein